MKLAKLRVIFPHRDEVTGEQYFPGDYREVPEHRVDFYLRPSLNEGVVILAISPDVWKPEHAAVYPNGETPAAFFEGRPESAPEAESQEVVSPAELVRESIEAMVEAPAEEAAEEDEVVVLDDPATPQDEAAEAAVAKKARKSNK